MCKKFFDIFLIPQKFIIDSIHISIILELRHKRAVPGNPGGTPVIIGEKPVVKPGPVVPGPAPTTKKTVKKPKSSKRPKQHKPGKRPPKSKGTKKSSGPKKDKKSKASTGPKKDKAKGAKKSKGGKKAKDAKPAGP